MLASLGVRDLQAQLLVLAAVTAVIWILDSVFSYSSGGEVLRGLDLQMSAGRTTAIVGATGAGKSTIVKLLLRLYDPQQGRVVLDGVHIRDLRLADLRSAYGLVSQDVSFPTLPC